jgi:TonB-dependent receptor
MKSTIQRLLILLLAVCYYNFSFAQDKGSITGKVVEAESGFTVIGATVAIPDLSIGTITDLDGNYVLRNLEPGTYTVECSYLGFAKKTITEIEVTANNPTAIDFALVEEDLAVEEEVIVEARQIRNTETSLLTLKRQSSSVLDGISSAQIKKTGDNDAASAMRRITGVTVEGGKYIYVRGLGDRYSKTTLNGAEIPGLDPNRNTVQMDLFPTNLLDNILVYKSFTPELYGDFTGGYVDIATKDFPDQLTVNLSASASYNTANTFLQINDYQGGKLDWLGFDDGTRALPDVVSNTTNFPNFTPSGSTNFNATDAQLLEDITTSFPNNWSMEERARGLNQNYSISIGNQVKLAKRPLGFIAALTYQNTHSGYNGGRYGIYELAGQVANTNTLTSQLVLNENIGVDDVLWGGMFSTSYKLNNNNKIGFTFLRNQSATSTARYSQGSKPRDDPDDIFITQSWRYLQRSLTTYQLRGKHVFGKEKEILSMKWQSSYSVSTQDDPDLRYFTYRIEPTGVADIKTSDNPPSRFYRDMQQGNFSNRIDFSLPFEQWNDLTAKFKFGASYVNKARQFRENRYVFTESGVVTFNSVETYFDPANLIDYAAAENGWANGGNGIYTEPGVDLKNSYDASQDVIAGYAMVDMPLSKKLRFIGGLRLENTAVRMLSLDPALQADSTFALNGETKLLDNLDFLPSVSLNYELNDKMKLRFAYSRTLARPTFRELAPYTSFDVDGGYLLAGNPALQRTITDNFDLRYEFYPTFAELISVGGFFKRFDSPIERTFNPTAPNSEITFRNVDQAILFGGELEIRKNLGFMGAFAKDFSLAANFAYIYSRTNIDPLELNEIRAFDPEASAFREMFGQSPFSTNFLLSYKNEKGTTANLVFNVIGPRISVIVRGGTPNVYERPVPMLGFNISQEFAKNFKATFRANNLLNSMYRESIVYKGSEYFVQSRPIGMSFSLGVSYALKGKDVQ